MISETRLIFIVVVPITVVHVLYRDDSICYPFFDMAYFDQICRFYKLGIVFDTLKSIYILLGTRFSPVEHSPEG